MHRFAMSFTVYNTHYHSEPASTNSVWWSILCSPPSKTSNFS